MTLFVVCLSTNTIPRESFTLADHEFVLFSNFFAHLSSCSQHRSGQVHWALFYSGISKNHVCMSLLVEKLECSCPLPHFCFCTEQRMPWTISSKWHMYITTFCLHKEPWIYFASLFKSNCSWETPSNSVLKMHFSAVETSACPCEYHAILGYFSNYDLWKLNYNPIRFWHSATNCNRRLASCSYSDAIILLASWQWKTYGIFTSECLSRSVNVSCTCYKDNML